MQQEDGRIAFVQALSGFAVVSLEGRYLLMMQEALPDAIMRQWMAGVIQKRLQGDEMPLTARMMAIADIFETLTASERPYKKAKTLSEAIH